MSGPRQASIRPRAAWSGQWKRTIRGSRCERQMIARWIVEIERKPEIDLRRGQAGMTQSSLNLLETCTPSVRKRGKRSTAIVWASHKPRLVGVDTKDVEHALR